MIDSEGQCLADKLETVLAMQYLPVRVIMRRFDNSFQAIAKGIIPETMILPIELFTGRRAELLRDHELGLTGIILT